MTDTTDTAKDGADAAKKASGDQTLLAQAQDAVTEAITATVDAVKANPLAAAGIAAGAAAAVAGAAYGASKLLAKDEAPAKNGKKS